MNVAIGYPIEAGESHRQHMRPPLDDVPGQLVTLGTITEVKCDLTETGARFRIPCPVPLGGDAVLGWLEFEASGRIVWKEREFAGVQFDDPISHETVVLTARLAVLAADDDPDWPCHEAAWISDP